MYKDKRRMYMYIRVYMDVGRVYIMIYGWEENKLELYENKLSRKIKIKQKSIFMKPPKKVNVTEQFLFPNEYLSLQYIDTACLYLVSSILKTGSTWKPMALGLDFTTLTHFNLSLHLHFRTLKLLLITLVFIRSNWQNYHRFLLESLRPINIIYNI